MSMNCTIQSAVDKVKEEKQDRSTLDKSMEVEVTSTTDEVNIGPITQGEMETQQKTSILMDAVRSERRASDKFDLYLQKVMSDTNISGNCDDRLSPVPFVNFDTTFDVPSRGMSILTTPRNTQNRYRLSLGNEIWMTPNRVFDTSLLNKSDDETVHASFSAPALTDNVHQLQDDIVSLRRSSDAFEKQLQKWLDN